MTLPIRLAPLLAAILFSMTAVMEAAEPQEPLSRIGFGSCVRQDKPAPIWDSIAELKPQLFLFIGDNIYADTEDMAVMRAKYKLLTDMPGYKRLKSVCPILATWDDHDYGVNDGGVEYPKKKESQKIFFEAFDEPADSPRRKREGVYDAKVFGPEGKRTQIILLDTRYFRSPLQKTAQSSEPGEGMRGPYGPSSDPKATVLGEEQWKWLAEQLRQPAEVRIIASSIQVIPDEHGWEKWGNFPAERQRLFDLIRETKAAGVVLISGDRHLAEISKVDTDVGYPLIDVTSSSLNQPSGNFTKSGARFINEINGHRIGLTYFDVNFGFIEIDWEKEDPVIRMQVRDEKGAPVLQQRLMLSQLQVEKK